MTESLARISSILGSAKEFTIDAALTASSNFSESLPKPQEIPKLLSSRTERDLIKGMQGVVSSMAKGEDVTQFFADVVKNITSSNLKVKSLVLVYLTKYSELEPDTALLSINSIQRLLSDKRPRIRGSAIRVLTGIKISSIVPMLLLCIKRTMADPSSFVRASTAIAIGKVIVIDKSCRKTLFQNLNKLLSDSEPEVVMAAIKSYYRVKDLVHGNWEPIHGNFRRFCSIIRELDEWSQILLIDLLIDYARKFLPKPSLTFRDQNGVEETVEWTSDFFLMNTIPYSVVMDDDLRLFINSLKYLTYSKSEAVVFSVTKAVYLLCPPKVFKEFKLDSILTRIASDKSLNQILALDIVLWISVRNSSLFQQQFRNFYVFPDDPIAVARTKILILSLLASEENNMYILEELKYYAKSMAGSDIAKEAVKAIGKCSQISTEWNEVVLSWCLKRIQFSDEDIIDDFLTVIRYLIQQRQKSYNGSGDVNQDTLRICYKLSAIIEHKTLKEDAKSSIVWIIGEYATATRNQIAPEILRKLLLNYADEAENVRYQILVLAAKVFAFELVELKERLSDDYVQIQEALNDNKMHQMFQHTLHLAKYDPSYDTRDRARMFNVLLSSGLEKSDLASLFLQVPKPAPYVELERSSNKTLSEFSLDSFMRVSDWADPADLPPPSVRQETEVVVNNFKNGNVSFNKPGNLPLPIDSTHAVSSAQVRNPANIAPSTKPTYQLQSLDEFFGSDVEEDSEDDSDDVSDVSSNSSGSVSATENDDTANSSDEANEETSSDQSSEISENDNQ